MTYGAVESSRYLGEPVSLYLFSFGPGDTDFFAYTDAEQVITKDHGDGRSAIDYQPTPVDRSKITSSGGLDKSNTTLSLPVDSGLAQLYLVYPPSQVTTLTMRGGHLSDPDLEFKVYWTGRVLSCSRKGSKAELTCEPVSTSMRRNGLRRRWQFGCPHALYGPDCGANKPAATTSLALAGASASRITLTGGWVTEAAAQKYLGGMVQWVRSGSTEIRTIIRIESAGTVLLMDGPATGLHAGSMVDVILGCNHKSGTPAQPDGDCGPLHDNILNFGGQEYIPYKNPIGFVNQYYGG